MKKKVQKVAIIAGVVVGIGALGAVGVGAFVCNHKRKHKGKDKEGKGKGKDKKEKDHGATAPPIGQVRALPPHVLPKVCR